MQTRCLEDQYGTQAACTQPHTVTGATSTDTEQKYRHDQHTLLMICQYFVSDSCRFNTVCQAQVQSPNTSLSSSLLGSLIDYYIHSTRYHRLYHTIPGAVTRTPTWFLKHSLHLPSRLLAPCVNSLLRTAFFQKGLQSSPTRLHNQYASGLYAARPGWQHHNRAVLKACTMTRNIPVLVARNCTVHPTHLCICPEDLLSHRASSVRIACSTQIAAPQEAACSDPLGWNSSRFLKGAAAFRRLHSALPPLTRHRTACPGPRRAVCRPPAGPDPLRWGGCRRTAAVS